MKVYQALRTVAQGMRFSNPKSSEIVIWDQMGSDRLVLALPPGKSYTILETRQKDFHISPQILYRMILNLRYINQPKLGQIYKIYLLSCVQVISPKAVITFIDNDIWFQELSRTHLKGPKYFAVQNGIKLTYDINPPSALPGGWLPNPPNPGSKIRLPTYFCFGTYEAELFPRFQHDVEKFVPIGSLPGGYFKSAIEPETPPIEYDLCFISQWRSNVYFEGAWPFVKVALDHITSLLKQYVNERPLRFAVACVTSDPREKKWLEDLFGSKAIIIQNERKNFTTYRTANRSHVTVTFSSAAGYEIFGWKRKVLFCNMTGDSLRNPPKQGIWSIQSTDYSEFKKKLDYLFLIDQKQFESEVGDYFNYVMNFNPTQPAHAIISQTLLETVESPLHPSGN